MRSREAGETKPQKFGKDNVRLKKVGVNTQVKSREETEQVEAKAYIKTEGQYQ